MQIAFLDKSQKDRVLPALFALFYENMQPIVSFGRSYAAEEALWLQEVSPALDKAPRQIVLCWDGDRIAGYVQYYVREHMLMVEELQLKPGQMGLIVNRAPGGVLDDGIKAEIEKHGLKLFGVLPHDEAVYRCDCDGEPSARLPESDPMKSALKDIMRSIGL